MTRQSQESRDKIERAKKLTDGADQITSLLDEADCIIDGLLGEVDPPTKNRRRIEVGRVNGRLKACERIMRQMDDAPPVLVLRCQLVAAALSNVLMVLSLPDDPKPCDLVGRTTLRPEL